MSTKRPTVTVVSDLIQKYVGSDFDKIKEISDNLPAILADAGLTLAVDYLDEGFPQETLEALLGAMAVIIKANEAGIDVLSTLNNAILQNTNSIIDLIADTPSTGDADLSGYAWFLDEDDMVSNDATKAVSQQSIRAYVAAQIIASGLYQGGYDALTNTPDLENAPISTIFKGYNWDVVEAGTFNLDDGNIVVAEGDKLKAAVNDPVNVADWVRVPNSASAASIRAQYLDNSNFVAFGTVEYTDSEKNKLSGIEPGAQVDQTGAEIKALYELEVNAFTDALFTKLAGIEAGATADLTGAEILALIVLEADFNILTDALLIKLNGIETNATADQTGAEIKFAYESEPDTNPFTDTAEAKLAGIEIAADVTDAANVDAAGAVMETDTSVATMSFVINDPTFATATATNLNSADATKQYIAQQIAAEVVSDTSYKGGYNAAVNTPDLVAGTGIKKGDAYDVTVAGLLLHGLDLEVGDMLRANKITPTAAGDWVVLQGNLTAASIKTQYESNADTNAFTDAEQTKLAGIESAATADQTDGEIKTAYENNADTNAFTDAAASKLSGIEANATADQTGAEIKVAYEGEANTNAFTDAEQTKLAGIAAAAGIFGSEQGYTESTVLSANATAVPSTKVTHTIPLGAPSGVYRCEIDTEWSQDNINGQVGINLTFNGFTQKNEFIAEAANAADWDHLHRTFRITHVNGVASVLNMDFRTPDVTGISSVRESSITVWRLS